MLQRVNDTEHRATTPGTSVQRPFQNMDQDRQESIIIVLDTLEKCLANQPKDTTKFEEAMNVKLLLREICQFIGERNNGIYEGTSRETLDPTDPIYSLHSRMFENVERKRYASNLDFQAQTVCNFLQAYRTTARR